MDPANKYNFFEPPYYTAQQNAINFLPVGRHYMCLTQFFALITDMFSDFLHHVRFFSNRRLKSLLWLILSRGLKAIFSAFLQVPLQNLQNLWKLKVWVIFIMILRAVNDASMKKSALFFTLKYDRSAENSKKEPKIDEINGFKKFNQMLRPQFLRFHRIYLCSQSLIVNCLRAKPNFIQKSILNSKAP